MQFFTTVLAACAALASVVSALENPFSLPVATSVLVAGSTFNITWKPTTTGTVTLVLKKGLSTKLDTISTIASSIANSGSYLWSIPSTLETGNDYALEIDSAAKDVNYTPQFTISGVAAVSSASGTTTATVVSTRSVVSTSVVATTSVYESSVSTIASVSTVVSISTSGAASVSIPTHTNGTIAISTLVPTAKETSTRGGSGTTGTSTGTSTGLPRPSVSSPSSAGSLRVALGMLVGSALMIAALMV